MRITHEQGDPRDLTLPEENARYMRHETYQRLVANIRKDGVLQQWPFVWHDRDTGKRNVLSGTHRVRAAIDAGLDVIDWTECDERLTEDERTAIQLSHNSLVGEDDPTILRRLYESIREVDYRLYSGLDDESLDLLSRLSTESLSEANLDYWTLSMVFLPPEFERALEAFRDATALLGSAPRQIVIGRDDQYQAVMDAIEDARQSAHVMNAATAFDLLLDVWDRHREDLADNWGLSPQHDLPVTSVFGSTMPVETAQALKAWVEKLGGPAKAWPLLQEWVQDQQ